MLHSESENDNIRLEVQFYLTFFMSVKEKHSSSAMSIIDGQRQTITGRKWLLSHLYCLQFAVNVTLFTLLSFASYFPLIWGAFTKG